MQSLNSDNMLEEKDRPALKALLTQTPLGQRIVSFKTRDLLPDVMLLDIGLPDWSGLEVAGKVAIACPATTIVMLTMWEDRDNLFAAFKAGARSYVVKGETQTSPFAQQ